MSSELIVKLLFPVAEPAHSTRRIARDVENIADNSRDLLFSRNCFTSLPASLM